MALKSIEQKVQSVVSPIQRFVRDESVSSGVLLVATLLALVLANSRFAEAYLGLLHAPLRIAVGTIALETDLRFVINEFLMVLFFLVLGMEIKRELLVGELKEPARSIPVIAAALGGMLAPAIVYMLFNAGLPSSQGWGIPVATDTAFALGVLMLLGRRSSKALKAFLVAFAVIDDLGAIIVIALFYSGTINYDYLSYALACFLLLLGCNLVGLRHMAFYLLIGFVLWICILQVGIHGTVTGVLIAATVPARPRYGRGWFVSNARQLIGRLEGLHSQRRDTGILSDLDQHATVEAVEDVVKSATTPLRRWERALERPVLLLILPLFALTNAGIPLTSTLLGSALESPIAWGIVCGLLFGKVIGISLLTWLTLRCGVGRLGEAMTMQHVVGVALLGGMGFTMSVFIAGLSFSGEAELQVAKLAILVASALAGLAGLVWLRFVAR